jgi:hypothetical protein
MSTHDDDPRCPECGEPIGMTATYCMHCSADLTDEHAAADADGDLAWDADSGTGATASDGVGGDTTTSADFGGTTARGDSADGQLLDPDGLVDNTLTVLVGVAGGIVVGLLGTIVFAIVSTSWWALPFGFVAWLGSTAYLVRRSTVQGAVAKSGYAVAVVLLLVPLVTLSPVLSVEGGLVGRAQSFVILLVFVAIPAGISAVVGFLAAQFVPDELGASDG